MVEDRFDDTDLHGGEFAGVYWAEADLSKGRLTGSDFADATLTDATFTWATCNGATFRNAALDGATFTDATAAGADFAGADLSGAAVERTGLHGADFTSANLTDADLTDCWLRDARFADACLDGATLSGAHLAGADLTDADLRGADLTGTTFRDADLTGATLDDANLSGVTLDGATLPEEFGPAGEHRSIDRTPMDGEQTVGEAAVDLLVEHGYGPREDIEGCSDAAIQELEAACGVSLPAAYCSFLRQLGEYAGGPWRGMDGPYHTAPQRQNEFARETTDSWDEFAFAYDDADFVFLGLQGYSFWFFDTREGPNPPVYNHMENEGPTERADSFSEWLFAEIRE